MLVNNQDENNLDLKTNSLNPSNFDNNMQSKFVNSFSVTHVNIRSLTRNIGELSFLYEYSLASKI